MNDSSLDVKFYRSIYPDLRFLAETQLVDHYKNLGSKENRLPNVDVLNSFITSLEYPFDCDFYRKQYDDVPNSNLHTMVHYYTHGSKETRVYNPLMLGEDELLVDVPIIESTTTQNVELPKYNIFIELVGESTTFNRCISSVTTQKFQHINHHIYVLYKNTYVHSKYMLAYTNENITYINSDYFDKLESDRLTIYLTSNLSLGKTDTCCTIITNLINNPGKTIKCRDIAIGFENNKLLKAYLDQSPDYTEDPMTICESNLRI